MCQALGLLLGPLADNVLVEGFSGPHVLVEGDLLRKLFVLSAIVDGAPFTDLGHSLRGAFAHSDCPMHLPIQEERTPPIGKIAATFGRKY